jgi:hypothetical protein
LVRPQAFDLEAAACCLSDADVAFPTLTRPFRAQPFAHPVRHGRDGGAQLRHFACSLAQGAFYDHNPFASL